ncbi:hypothetical protein [Metabacillus fastidiosus]|uniref:hypothetical protein n=1 Tax=Metabacillus fastidiosus TaxID=1458 RepID=UPI0008251389|nr:hypothetical protein [Metabacillus fastidiosus]
MKKFVLILILILSACGTNQQSASGDLETFTHDFEQNGLALKATIKIGKDIKVDASITNTSRETIIYNGRCGIPFGISVKKEDANSYLVTGNEQEESCDDIFDPNDLREMKPNETFEKEITFKRKVSLTNERTVNALSGMYEMSFSFQTHDNERFFSSLPLELMNDEEPEIMTVDQAKEMAKENKEVMKWFDEHEKENMSIESKDAILSEGMWTVVFHAIHKDGADRIIINMNAKSGNIKAIHYEELGKDVLEFLE